MKRISTKKITLKIKMVGSKNEFDELTSQIYDHTRGVRVKTGLTPDLANQRLEDKSATTVR